MHIFKKLFFWYGFIIVQQLAVGQNIDVDILKAVNKTETGFKNSYFGFISSSVNPTAVAVPLGIAVAGFVTKDPRLKQDALFMGATILASTLVTTTTKHIVNRKRPFAVYPFIIKREDTETWLSFPSGHTSAAFCTATALALRYPKWYVIVPAGIYAVSAGWARMYQGVHYPSDVLAGAMVGAGSAWLGYKAQQWITRKKHQKKQIPL